MPHEKINHGPKRNSLRLVWGMEPYPDEVFLEAVSWTTGMPVSVALANDDVDKLIASLRRAKRRTCN